MKMSFRIAVALAPVAAILALPAAAQEAFAGVYAHEVDTPFSLRTDEGGLDLQFGYRFGPQDRFAVIGRPEPYLIASINTKGDTSFAGAGLSWTIGNGPIYFRPGVGLVVHDGPSTRFVEDGVRTDLGSRILFEPEVAVGFRVRPRLAVEASWVHVSHARLFNSDQNPGIDMIGVRLALALP